MTCRARALTTRQIAIIAKYAKALPAATRQSFVDAVLDHLGVAPSDAAVHAAAQSTFITARIAARIAQEAHP
jgi:hypothetical protein